MKIYGRGGGTDVTLAQNSGFESGHSRPTIKKMKVEKGYNL